ncbi:ATP-binding protein [Rothia nasimurium]|uniref:ATP-binding protein n=1 Tax=Rothia nasimurium TaxID=85336 RepID=UPI001F1D5AD3|nr:ATP-binding protein [Rothia nasimurium]
MTQLLARDRYLDLLTSITDPALVRVITGVRRCGKSALLRMYREHLISHGVAPHQILSINFEDMSNDNLRDPQIFHAHVLETIENHEVRFLHIDEVQELNDWARVVNSLRSRENLEICVTGSNASMFISESITYLAGRYIEISMLPLSLTEFTRFREHSGIHFTGAVQAYQQWIKWGTFPAAAVTTNEEVVRQLNTGLFDSIFTRDIALRGQIRDTEAFLRVARFVFDNAGSELSTLSIVKQLKSHGRNVSSELVDRYLQLMVDAHLLYRCRRYDTQGKQWLKTNGKMYFVDPGLRNSLLGSRDYNRGRDLENMVYLELLRRGFEVTTGQVPEGEIDFLAKKEGRTIYIQVALTTESEQTLARELAPFQRLSPGARCLLLTGDRFAPSTGDIEWLDVFEFLAGSSF